MENSFAKAIYQKVDDLIENSEKKTLKIRLLLYLRCIRIKEVILIGGVTFLGLLFSVQNLSFALLMDWALVMISTYLLLGHVYLYNDWQGYAYDRNDLNKQDKPVVSGKISLTEIKILAIILLLVSLSIALYFSVWMMIVGLTIAFLNFIYSNNKIFLKSVPVMSSMLHGVGATLGFKFGTLYQGEWTASATLFGIYFGIVYAAGHLNHEITDFESDKNSGVPTHAVVFGKTKAFKASFILFSVSFLYITALSFYNILPRLLIAGVSLAYPIYVFFYMNTLKQNLSHGSMINFRTQYRMLYLLWGIFLAICIAI